MRRWTWAYPIILAVASATASGACATGHQNGSSANATASPSWASPAVSPTAADPGPASGTPPPITPGEVEIRLSNAAYRSGETVQATVVNGLDRAIHTEDFKTDCTIVVLQRQQSGSWSDVIGCALGRPTATITLEPGTTHSVTINPNSFHLRDSPPQAGTYRIKVGYRLTRDPHGDEPLIVYSTEFAWR